MVKLVRLGERGGLFTRDRSHDHELYSTGTTLEVGILTILAEIQKHNGATQWYNGKSLAVRELREEERICPEGSTTSDTVPPSLIPSQAQNPAKADQDSTTE